MVLTRGRQGQSRIGLLEVEHTRSSIIVNPSALSPHLSDKERRPRFVANQQTGFPHPINLLYISRRSAYPPGDSCAAGGTRSALRNKLIRHSFNCLARTLRDI